MHGMETQRPLEISTHTELALPQTIDELKEFCVERKLISPNVRLCPGQRMEGILDYEKGKAGGVYGIELSHRHEVIATSGFELWKNEFEEKFIRITHAPQGKKSNQISPVALRKLRSHDFRARIVQKYLPLAIAMKQVYIQGISAENHPKVKNRDISLERGKEIMDEVYERCGYTKGRDGNYYLFANQLPGGMQEFQMY